MTDPDIEGKLGEEYLRSESEELDRLSLTRCSMLDCAGIHMDIADVVSPDLRFISSVAPVLPQRSPFPIAQNPEPFIHSKLFSTA
uniref:Uncharacterized protein n=1 Tax=Physcomitrium patens TaxID=3218 RepID=A0A2K1KNS1_PHYPA|nr:hypothetical protein PHYPA_006325 [Physcomitrium patens]